MKKIFTLFAAMTCMMSMFALTYNVTVPAGTKACYIAGEMNGWSQVEMSKVDATHYTLEVTDATDAMKYKYCSGPTWAYVEKTANGDEVADRTYSANDVVESWAAVYDPTNVPNPGDTKDITIKAKVPAAWTNQITAWVWPTGGAGEEVIPTQEGEWYVVTRNCTELNIIYKNGAGWNGDANQTVDMTFTENACIEITAGSGKATYTVVDCGGSVDPNPNPSTYYVTGNDALVGTLAWDAAAIQMTQSGNVYTHTFTGLAVGVECQMKVTNGTWDQSWGFSAVKDSSLGVKGSPEGNIAFTLAEEGDVVVTFDGTNVSVTGNFIAGEPAVITYVLMGVAGDWTTGIALEPNPENENEYCLLGQEITEADAVKVVTLSDGVAIAWCGNVDEFSVEHNADDMGNIVLTPGKYDFYYKVAEDLIYIGATTASVDNVVVAGKKATKMIIDGQIVVVRDGIKFNMLGQEVK